MLHGVCKLSPHQSAEGRVISNTQLSSTEDEILIPMAFQRVEMAAIDVLRVRCSRYCIFYLALPGTNDIERDRISTPCIVSIGNISRLRAYALANETQFNELI